METLITIPEEIVERCRKDLGWDDDQIKQAFVDHIKHESQGQFETIIRYFFNFVNCRLGQKGGYRINKKNIKK
jgi:hypothetical protein